MHAHRLGLAIAMALASSALNAGAPTAQPRYVIDAADASDTEAVGLQAFATTAGEPVAAVFVELGGTPGVYEYGSGRADAATLRTAASAHDRSVLGAQRNVVAAAQAAGIALLPRVRTVVQPNGVAATTAYRFGYLVNGFIAYVPLSRVAALRAVAGVRSVSDPLRFHYELDNSVNYLLGSESTIAARRLAVYGATEELDPPIADTAIDGFEGQGVHIGIIDSGTNYEHPMFGGSGVGTTPLPQVAPAAGPSANSKELYYYDLGGATNLDDNGHGTHVSSTAAGFRVDGDTTAVLMRGGFLVGPTPQGVTLHGVAPQAHVLSWALCDAAGTCPGDVELAIEDAASPTIKTGSGDGGSVDSGTAKPVADVINMSLGGSGDSDSSSARVSTDAFLAGLVVVAAAGNDGPGQATIGSPCIGAGAICVASAHDPGSTANSDLLEADQVGDAPTYDPCADSANDCTLPAPSPDTGTDATADVADPAGPSALRMYAMAGGGPLPGNALAAHYVYVDRDQTDVPSDVTGRIALLENGTGTFFQIVNPVAASNPAAIVLITDVTSATAVAVVGGVPAYTLGQADGAALKAKLLSSGAEPAHGAVSQQPLRISTIVDLPNFHGQISDFSSRGPAGGSNFPVADYRLVKPDITGLGQNILAATTTLGTPSGTVGAADPSGYTTLNGTSMASPHITGAAALVRQRVRALGYDSADTTAGDYIAKRFRAAVITRALLSNTATDLRNGDGSPDLGEPNPAYTIQDVGAGLADIDAAVHADAIMTSPTRIYSTDPHEFGLPDDSHFQGPLPLPVNADGSVDLPLPSAAFGRVRALGVAGTTTVTRAVTIEDIDGSGGGNYALAVVNDVLSDHPAVTIDFVDDAGNPITQVNVPTNGAATYNVRVRINGAGGLGDPSLLSWYVTATPAAGRRLRMPFELAAVTSTQQGLAAPSDLTLTDVDSTGSDGCSLDSDNTHGAQWQFMAVDGNPPLQGFVLQSASYATAIFSDDASEPLVNGSNSLWMGSTQWVSSTDANTGSLAYTVPQAADQEETLTLKSPLALPAGSNATLSVYSDLTNLDGIASLRAQRDSEGYNDVAQFPSSAGTFSYSLNAFTGGAVSLEFLITTGLISVPGGAWSIDNIVVGLDDFVERLRTDSATTSVSGLQETRSGKTYFRVAALYDDNGSTLIGPFSNTECVCVPSSAIPVETSIFRDGFDGADSGGGETCQ